MAFELIEVEALLKDVKPKKKGKKDDAPLLVILPFEVNMLAIDILPYFHPTLRDFLFTEKGVRFNPYMDGISWSEEHKNMEVELAELTLQAEKIGRYKISPFDDGQYDDRDESNRVFLSFTATIQLSDSHNPIGLLSELINTTIPLTIRPSQLNLLDES